MDDNYSLGVGAIVLQDHRILLVRHTYGPAAGKLLNPGGFVKYGELPFDAVKREVKEETDVDTKPVGMLSVRCSTKDWYMAFLCDYVSGRPKPDGLENSEALFMDCGELLERPDATDTVKTLLRLALRKKPLLPLNAGKGRVMFACGDER